MDSDDNERDDVRDFGSDQNDGDSDGDDVETGGAGPATEEPGVKAKSKKKPMVSTMPLVIPAKRPPVTYLVELPKSFDLTGDVATIGQVSVDPNSADSPITLDMKGSLFHGLPVRCNTYVPPCTTCLFRSSIPLTKTIWRLLRDLRRKKTILSVVPATAHPCKKKGTQWLKLQRKRTRRLPRPKFHIFQIRAHFVSSELIGARMEKRSFPSRIPHLLAALLFCVVVVSKLVSAR